MRSYRPSALVLALALGACTGGAERAERTGLATRVDTVGGVVVVRNEGTPPAWSAEPLLTLGSAGDVGAAGPSEFGRVTSVVADAEGSVYVADIQAQEIRVFGPGGEHLRTLGRKGQGPGEIGDLYSLAWLGDTLAVLDPRNARVGLFSKDGAWAGSWRWQPLSGTTRFLRAGDDETYVLTLRFGADGGSERRYVRYRQAGPADTVPAPRWPEQTKPVVCSRPDGGISSYPVPFAPKFIYAFAPGGELVVVPGGDYRIAFLDAAGDTVRVVERAHTAVRVEDAEWREAVRPYREFRERMPGARCEGDMARPAHKSVIRHLLFDHAGRMWVESVTADGFAWDVFDREGALLGTLPAPPRREGVHPYMRDGRLYLVDADSLDVQYVHAYGVSEARSR